MLTSRKRSVFAFHKPEKSSGYDFTVTTAPRFHLVPWVTGGLRRLYADIKAGRERPDENHGWITDNNGVFQLLEDGCKIGLRYKCTKILGCGQSSVFVQAEDQFCDGALVAIKVLHAHYFGLGAQESQCMMRLNRADPHCISGVVRIKTVFVVGSHYCMVFEALSPAPLTNSFTDCPRVQVLPKLRQAAGGLIKALGFLHQQSVIHADLKPENILLQTADDIRSLKLIDFGNALHCIHDEVSTYYDDFDLQTLIYRAPEVLYGMPFGTEVDLWSLGCVLAEMYLQKPLFLGRNKNELLTEMVDLLGHVPSRIVQRGKFYPDLQAYTTYNYTQPDATSKLLKRLNHLDFAFANFISSLLRYDPVERATVSRAAAHVFLGSELGTRLLMPPEYDSDGGNVYPGLCITSRMYKHQPVVDISIKYQHLDSQDLLRTGTHDLTAAPRRSVAEVAPVQRSISPEELAEFAPLRHSVSPELIAGVAPLQHSVSPEQLAEFAPLRHSVSPELIAGVAPLEHSVSPEEEVVLFPVTHIRDVAQSDGHNHCSTNNQTNSLNSNYESRLKQASNNHDTVRTERDRNYHRNSIDKYTVPELKNGGQINTSHRHRSNHLDSSENDQDSEMFNKQKKHYDSQVCKNIAVTESNEQVDPCHGNSSLMRQNPRKMYDKVLKSKNIRSQAHAHVANNLLQIGERIKEEAEVIPELMQLKCEADGDYELAMQSKNAMYGDDDSKCTKNEAISERHQKPLELMYESPVHGHNNKAQSEEVPSPQYAEHDRLSGQSLKSFRNMNNHTDRATSRINQTTVADLHCLGNSGSSLIATSADMKEQDEHHHSRKRLNITDYNLVDRSDSGNKTDRIIKHVKPLADCSSKIYSRSTPDVRGISRSKDGTDTCVHKLSPTNHSKRQSNSIGINQASNSNDKLHEVTHSNQQQKTLSQSVTSDGDPLIEHSLNPELNMRSLSDKNLVQNNSNIHTFNKQTAKSSNISENTFLKSRHKAPKSVIILNNSSDRLPGLRNTPQNSSDISPNIDDIPAVSQDPNEIPQNNRVPKLQKSKNRSQRNKDTSVNVRKTSQENGNGKLSTDRIPGLNNQVNSSCANDNLLADVPSQHMSHDSHHQNISKDHCNECNRRRYSLSKCKSLSTTTSVCKTDSASDMESPSDAVKFVHKVRSQASIPFVNCQQVFPSDVTYETGPSNNTECSRFSQVSSPRETQLTEKVRFSNSLTEYMEQNSSEQTYPEIVDSTDLDSIVKKSHHGHFDDDNCNNKHSTKHTPRLETDQINTSTDTNITVNNYLKHDKSVCLDIEAQMCTENNDGNLETSAVFSESVRFERTICSPEHEFYVKLLTPHHKEAASQRTKHVRTMSAQKLSSSASSELHRKLSFSDNSDKKSCAVPVELSTGGHSNLPLTATSADMKEQDDKQHMRKRLKVTDHKLIDRSDIRNKVERIIKLVKPLEVNNSNVFDNQSKFLTSDSAALGMDDDDIACMARRRLQMLPEESIKHSCHGDDNASNKTVLIKEHVSKTGKRKRLLEVDDCVKSALSPNRVHISCLEKRTDGRTKVPRNCSDINLKKTGKDKVNDDNSAIKQTQYLISDYKHSKMDSKATFTSKHGNQKSRRKCDVSEAKQFFKFNTREKQQRNSQKKHVLGETFISSNDNYDQFHFKSNTESETEMVHRIINVRKKYIVKINNNVEPIHRCSVSKCENDEQMHGGYKSVPVNIGVNRNTDSYSASSTNRQKISMKPQLSEHHIASLASESLCGQSVNDRNGDLDSGPSLDDDLEEEVLLLSL